MVRVQYSYPLLRKLVELEPDLKVKDLEELWRTVDCILSFSGVLRQAIARIPDSDQDKNFYRSFVEEFLGNLSELRGRYLVTKAARAACLNPNDPATHDDREALREFFEIYVCREAGNGLGD